VPGLGTIVVGSNGHPVYRYDLDKNNPPTSNCSGGCLQAWPPVPATTQVTGVSSSLIGSVTATNGTKQLTIAGWPVYYYAADTGPGQTAGEGVGGVWWAVGPDGSEVKSGGSGGGAASSSSSSSGGSSGGSIGGY
jgi:predicted lipoprotein with Yx(FWY)xxD motif